MRWCKSFLFFVLSWFQTVFSDVSDIFRTDNVKIIENIVRDSYFSYSLLLQKGNNGATLLVGAPKNWNNKTNQDGNVYRCTWSQNKSPNCGLFKTDLVSSFTPNGNLFGVSLDGEDHDGGAVVACAPRFQSIRLMNQPFTKGYCLFVNNSTKPEINKTIPIFGALAYGELCCRTGESFYDYGYAMGGLDVSFYNQDGPKMLVGAPGVKRLSGTTAMYSCDTSRLDMVMPVSKDLNYNLFDGDGYFGYSVTTLKLSDGDQTVFLAGAPRGHNLIGVVRLYNYDIISKTNMTVIKTFYGFEIGAYFGASLLAVDVTRDKLTDIFISAPMTKGNTWDEGAVYFYSNIKYQGDLKPSAVLTSKYSDKGGRFGTAMSSLGDYDLDGYNDVAIAAPYEDGGVGAVYIYRGTYLGVTLAQRITPSQFNLNKPSRGFGLGLSRGNDVDLNGHNDVAIGSYKTDQAFIVHSRSIIDFACHLSPGSSALSSNMTKLSLTLCIAVTTRSERFPLSEVPFNINMDSMDYRLTPEKKRDVMKVPFNNPTCKPYVLDVKDMFLNIQPLEINVTVSVEIDNVVANGNKYLLFEIPYQHGCGGDNKCETGLSIDLTTQRKDFIIGRDRDIIVKVIVENKADTAYKCEVNFEVPDGVELRSSRYCAKSESFYVCRVSNRLESGRIEHTYIFEVTNLNISLNHIIISARVAAFGKNQPGYKNIDTLSVPVKLVTKPFLDSQSPNNVQLSTKDDEDEELTVTHNFTVGNSGPSPLLFDIIISVPVITYKDQSAIEITDVTGLMGSEFSCVRTEDTKLTKRDVSKLSNISLNKTIVLSCGGDTECRHYMCKNILIDSSRDVATFQVKTVLKSNLLVKALISELNTKDFIAYMPSAVINYSDGSLNATSVFLIIAQVSYIPLWVYLVAALVAAFLLMVIIFILYKCHFFDRNLKDKLMQERILNEDDAINEEIYNEEVFDQMKSYDQSRS